MFDQEVKILRIKHSVWFKVSEPFRLEAIKHPLNDEIQWSINQCLRGPLYPQRAKHYFQHYNQYSVIHKKWQYTFNQLFILAFYVYFFMLHRCILKIYLVCSNVKPDYFKRFQEMFLNKDGKCLTIYFNAIKTLSRKNRQIMAFIIELCFRQHRHII